MGDYGTCKENEGDEESPLILAENVKYVAALDEDVTQMQEASDRVPTLEPVGKKLKRNSQIEYNRKLNIIRKTISTTC